MLILYFVARRQRREEDFLLHYAGCGSWEGKHISVTKVKTFIRAPYSRVKKGVRIIRKWSRVVLKGEKN